MVGGGGIERNADERVGVEQRHARLTNSEVQLKCGFFPGATAGLPALLEDFLWDFFNVGARW